LDHLYYSRTKAERFNTLGAISLAGGLCKKVLIPAKEFGFTIKSGTRNFYFAAANDVDRMEWINVINICIENMKSAS